MIAGTRPYLEMAMGIANVRANPLHLKGIDPSKEFMYMPSLHLNGAMPTVVGRKLFLMNKRFTKTISLDKRGNFFVANGKMIKMKAKFKTLSDKSGDYRKIFEDFSSHFTLPSISIKNGRAVCSEMSFNLRDIKKILPVKAQVSIDHWMIEDTIIKNLRFSANPLEKINAGQFDGAYYFESAFTLSYPNKCFP